MVDLYLKYSGIDNYITHTKQCTAIGASQRITSAIRFITATIDSEKSLDFFSRLFSGDGLDIKSPILLLRNFLIARSRHGLQDFDQTCVVVKAWNSFYSGTSIKQIKHAIDNETPKIAGIEIFQKRYSVR
jgi:hypothetical protein